MSDDTRQALDSAIRAHLADEADGAIVTGYVPIAANITADDLEREQHGYWVEYADHQPFHVSLGLVERHRLILHNAAQIDED